MSEQKVARVGCGSAYDGDRLDWSVDLAKSGAVSYLSFDCLAEGTMTAAQLRRNEDPSVGYAMNLLPVIESFEAFLGNGLKIIGNFGVSNTEAAVQATVDLLRQLGRYGIRVGAVHGDDIRTKAFELDLDLPDRRGADGDAGGGERVEAGSGVGRVTSSRSRA